MILAFTLALSPLAKAEPITAALESHPFAAPTVPRGATMFSTMPAAETGLVSENNYADPKMWGERYHEFEVGSVGTGVAIADYDGDGRPDIFVVSKTESCRLFRNLGNWKFEDVTEKAGVADVDEAAKIWKQGATFADVNNDGRLDLYVCRFGAPNLLYINQGNGTFKEEAATRGLAVVDASVVGAFCDYDRDGWLDVIVLTNMYDAARHPSGQRSYLFHNNGNGTFSNVTDRAGIFGEGQGHSATWWDFDNDGWPDLYVANDFGPPDQLYRNNRDGTFTNIIDQGVPHTTLSSMGADLGDVNNDGLIDFFVADMAATNHQKDQRGMAVMRARAIDPAAIGSPVAPQYPRNMLFLNTGVDRCLEAAYLAGLEATDWTWSPRFEDLDNDGRIDLFVTNGMHRESHNADLMAKMMLAPNEAEKVRAERSSPVLNEANLAFRNLGNLRFENVSAKWGLDEKGVSFGAAFGDLDGDGDLDLVYANYQKGITVLRNDCDAGHGVRFALRGTRSNRFGVGATVRIQTAGGIQVRQLVVARGVLSSSEPVLHFGLGEESRIERVTIDWPSGVRQTLESLAADQSYTVMEPGSATAPVLVKSASPGSRKWFQEVGKEVGFDLAVREPMVDELTQQPLLPRRLNREGPSLAVADLDGDGISDVVLGGTPRDPLRILFGGPDGTLRTGDASFAVQEATLDDGPLLVFDTNGDGALDLLVTRGGTALAAGSPAYQPRLYLNDGHGRFQLAVENALPALSISVGAAVAADFNGDGKPDLFLGARVLPGQYPTGPTSVLLINRGGRFEDATDVFAPVLRRVGMVTAALACDVDGDHRPDLIVATEWGGVLYFHNEDGRGFADLSNKAGFAMAGTGWWTALATSDLNGDGRPDFVVGNFGLNTPYRADPEHPALLFDGEFGDDGNRQLIEAYYENDKLYPRRTRKELGASIPAVAKRFGKNDAYARATLNEIFGDEKLNAADKYAATQLQSGVFLSEPNGRYRFEPLPRLAQIAPVQGIVAGDFNSDGHSDICLLQNTYAPVPFYGRFDGGLGQVLIGDGAGHFTAIPAAESGFVVPGNAKAIALTAPAQTGRALILVTRNDSTTLAFRRNSGENP